MIKRTGLLAISLTYLLLPTFSAVYYVATNGSDMNKGSITQPFASIQRAQEVVNPGDTIYTLCFSVNSQCDSV